MKIGENIKMIRKSKKMTQSQLAAKLGVTVGMISQYENNVNPPKIATLERIAEALDVNVLELYDGDIYGYVDERLNETREKNYTENAIIDHHLHEKNKNVYARLFNEYMKNDKIQIIRVCLSSLYRDSNIIFDENTSKYIIEWYDPDYCCHHSITLSEPEIYKLVDDIKGFFKYKLFEHSKLKELFKPDQRE